MKRRQALIAGMAAMHGASADPTTATWTVASGYRADSFHGQNLQKFGQDVESATGGALKVALLPGNASAARWSKSRSPCSGAGCRAGK